MAKQARDIAGKVVVITGGARGIGAATAKALVAEGARVVIGDLDRALAEQTAKELDADGRFLDVTDPDGVRAFLDAVEAEVGPVYALINNAGIMPLARVSEEDDASVLRQVEINLIAVIRGTKEAVNRMVPRRSGHIVNIASIAGKTGFPGGSTYCATKHGVVGYSEAVHRELRGSGVELTCVMPGAVRTELAAGLVDTRIVKPIEATDVAAAIVEAMKSPRLDVYVPRLTSVAGRWTKVLPRKVNERLLRVIKADQALAGAVHSSLRTDYERRAATDSNSARRATGESGG